MYLSNTGRKVDVVQDTFDRLFAGKSIVDRGTLVQLKNNFEHRSVSGTVMNAFNHAENFMRFVTEAHVVYRALEIACMDDVDSDPAQHFTCEEQKAQLVVDTTTQIVDEAWLLPAISEVKAVADCQLDPAEDCSCDCWCICGQGNLIKAASLRGKHSADYRRIYHYFLCNDVSLFVSMIHNEEVHLLYVSECCDDADGLMLRCSNSECALGTWFHPSCLAVSVMPRAADDWWCSAECRENSRSTYRLHYWSVL